MSAQATPSKQVRILATAAAKRAIACTSPRANDACQAASAIADLSMNDSAAKKLDFSGEWEDDNVARPVKGIPDLDDEPEEEINHPSTAPTIRKEEAHEPLLQENPHRFVLFPIKYHEVRVYTDASERVSRKVVLFSATNNTTDLADVQEGRGFFLDC